MLNMQQDTVCLLEEVVGSWTVVLASLVLPIAGEFYLARVPP